MNPPPPPASDSTDVIRITAEDASSTHVDDLLKRHASLRGEQGIARDRGRAWYYQNWFVFMIAGALGALSAYALLNPYFNDRLYVSGKVTQIDRTPTKPMPVVEGGKVLEIPPDRFLEVQVGDQRVVMATFTRWAGPDGKYTSFDPMNLKVGQNLGAYVTKFGGDDADRTLASFVVENPAPQRRDHVPVKTQEREDFVSQLLLFPLIAAFVGLFIAAADGILCHLVRRVLIAGAVGLVIGFVGGFLSSIIAELVYQPLTHFAAKYQGTAWGFSLQTAGRGFAWLCAGVAMGLGQGIALRSKRLFFYGLLGGIIGGLLGGLLFDPLNMLLARDKPSAQLSRWVGFGVIGATVGLMIGIVERLARDAWLRMVEGPLAGKEFLVFKDIMRMGSSPKSEIYLFNDKEVAAQHAVIRATGDIYEIENSCVENPVCLNGRPVRRSRLRHGDRISLGRTSFVFQRQRAD